MKKELFEIYNNKGDLLLIVELTEKNDLWIHGNIVEDYRLADDKYLFEEFEQLVNDQAFSLVDEVEEKIEELGLNLGHDQLLIKDVQIFGKKISFKMK